MKLLFDQNLSYKLIELLSPHFPDSEHVRKIDLYKDSDKTVWDYAHTHGFTIVTQDADFNELLSKFGHPPYVIWIRTGNTKTSHIKDLLIHHHKQLKAFKKQTVIGCYVLHDKQSRNGSEVS